MTRRKREIHRAVQEESEPVETIANTVESTDEVLTVDEGARFLRIGRNTLYGAIDRGEVPHRRVGRKIRISRAALVRWLDPCGQQVAKKGH